VSLSIQREIAGNIEVLVLSGEVDLSTLPRFTDALNKIVIQGQSTVALDLEMVTVLDDAALGIVLGSASRLRRDHRQLVLVCANQRITDFLQSTGVASLVTLVPSLSALSAQRAD
jgi:anti-anti-sigma factor